MTGPHVSVLWAALSAWILAVIASAAESKVPTVFVGDLVPTEARQDYGSLGIDRSVMGKPLQIGERRFQRGLGTHANSRITYDVEGPCQRFEAWVGVDAEMRGYSASSVVFKVLTDGRVVFQSGIMRLDTPAKRVSVPLDGVRELQLVVTDAGDGITCDHADWADAVIIGRPEGTFATPGRKQFEVAAPGIVVELARRRDRRRRAGRQGVAPRAARHDAVGRLPRQGQRDQ